MSGTLISNHYPFRHIALLGIETDPHKDNFLTARLEFGIIAFGANLFDSRFRALVATHRAIPSSLVQVRQGI